MKSFTFVALGILLSISACLGDVSHLLPHNYYVETTTVPPPPVPYSFHYKAGRFPGNVDRFQSESGDGSGAIQGTYSFIDPKFQIRTVDYTADKNGFHPVLKNFDEFQTPPEDSEAVKRERERHFALYQRIAESNSHGFISLPKETVGVAKAKERHLELFKKIAAEHQAIAAEREAERLAYEATSIPNDVNGQHV
ncbi:uncharacterized protein LOC107046494 [Diachasma alloeum]|uniref:uncharacterized protein LOC107046494 n=1 Tax=Diachasma alloeum TaxID=454923 RepID=UPI0007384D0E|nr:uncharacterized protein LOC107046494 [Diachasma alloeum]